MGPITNLTLPPEYKDVGLPYILLIKKILNKDDHPRVELLIESFEGSEEEMQKEFANTLLNRKEWFAEGHYLIELKQDDEVISWSGIIDGEIKE